METNSKNVLILSDNALVVNGLRHALRARFQNRMQVSGFCESKLCLKKVDQNTHAVILDYSVEGKSYLTVMNCIRAINPSAKIIMHTNREDVISALEKFEREEMVFAPQMTFLPVFASPAR